MFNDDDEATDRYDTSHPRCAVCDRRGCNVPFFQTGIPQCGACDHADSRPLLLVDGLWVHFGACLDFLRESDREARIMAACYAEMDKLVAEGRRS